MVAYRLHLVNAFLSRRNYEAQRLRLSMILHAHDFTCSSPMGAFRLTREGVADDRRGYSDLVVVLSDR